ncbi:CsbD family protein [Lacihabitans sp. LS3-19]|uniref:hypothetical protein n=1 Tax=Lacihabitans sp. LS3-19 TaxID=2487335 RepID=UPI0020CC8871|nr:hypothetical protein [Lacihabitans sp. LS3-19]MCP9768669.1 CsbD family protein [Lacihabitans sp. LS3-19]
MSTEEKNDIWKVQKKKLLNKYTFLTEDDLAFRDGNRSAMLENLQIKLCLNENELEKIFKNL